MGIKYKHLPLSKDIVELNTFDIENNLFNYSYHSKYLKNLQNKDFKPTCQLLTPMHKILIQDDRRIDWTKDNIKINVFPSSKNKSSEPKLSSSSETSLKVKFAV